MLASLPSHMTTSSIKKKHVCISLGNEMDNMHREVTNEMEQHA